MIKFAALNATEEDSSGGSQQNKEVVESDAFQKYNKALVFIKNKEHDLAEKSLKELLLHPYFNFDDATFSATDFFNDPAVKLTTSIYKNLGKVHENTANYDEALECYLEAVSSDKTDITTWFNIANVAIKKVNYTLACDSLKECININPSFWPSIDTLICLLYALGDYLSCLQLIQHSLSLNANFQRALCVKAQIETEDPFLFKNFKWKQGLVELQPDNSATEKELKFPRELREKDQQAKKLSLSSKTDPILFIRKLNADDPLADLGVAICELFVKSKEGDLSLFCPVDFSECNIEAILKERSERVQESTVTCPDESASDILEVKEVTDQERIDEKIAREAEKREGQRRSKRVQDLLVETNDPLETLATQLETWVPEPLKFFSEKSTPKLSVVAKDVSSTPDQGISAANLDEHELLQKIISFSKDSQILLVPLMKNYCNQLARHFHCKWSKSVIKSFMEVYLSYRQYEALPNILQSFEEHDTEENVLTLLCAFEIIVYLNLFPGSNLEDEYFKAVKQLITENALDKDQEFLKIANQHCRIKDLFKTNEMYDSFQLRFAWTYCLYEEKLGNIKCSLEYAKICLVKLKDTPLDGVVVTNTVVAQINSQSVEKQKIHLLEILEREDVANLFKEKNYSRVVELLKPMLDETNNEPQTDSDQIPIRHKNLLILLESLKKLSMMESCLKCAELLLHELVPFLRFTDTCKSLLTKIYKSLISCLHECDVTSNDINHGRIMNNTLKVILKFFEQFFKDGLESGITRDYPIQRALMIYHSLIDKYANEGMNDSEVVNHNVARIQSLTLCHEILGEHGMCSINSGVILTYIIDCCVTYKIDNVFIEDANNLMEQALFCHIGHPGTGSKRSKKNRVDHGSSNVQLNLELAKKVYEFYRPDQLYNPMEKTKHFSADTFELMTKTIGLFDTDVSKSETFHLIKMSLEKDTIPCYDPPDVSGDIQNFRDIFYLCGDYLWKYDEFVQAIDCFICDLVLNPSRMQSWLCLGLCWLSIAEDRFNNAQSDLKVVIESIAPKAVLCFDHYMSKSPTEFEVASEYSIFLYTIASVYNQVAGALADNVPVIQEIDLKRLTLITKAKEVLLKGIDPIKPKSWIKSFLLGKVSEKLDAKNLVWLDHYVSALNELQDFHQLLSRKINTSSPVEYSMECFELVFRISYSIYKRCSQYSEILKDSTCKQKIQATLKQSADLMSCKCEIGVDDIQSISKVSLCILEECFSKWPEHYKIRNALCKMIHDSASPNSDDFLKAKSLMLQDSSNSSGMFLFTRKNLFLGIWRIPVDTVDRPGGFFRHMRKSLSLIIASLTHCKDISNLIRLFENMAKTADQLNNFVGDVTQFLQTTLTQFDTLLRCRVSEYCSSPAKHTTEHSIKLLKLCIKVKDIHVSSNIATKPVDEAMLVVLKLFKLTVPQQIALCDPRIMESTGTLYETANNLINDFEKVQKMTALLELEKQKKRELEIVTPVSSSSGSSKETTTPSEPSDNNTITKNKVKDNEKIVVNDAAKTAVRQAVATFITQMAEKNQTKGNANVSQILNIINNSVKTKENSAKIRELLLKAVNKENSNSSSKVLAPNTTESKNTDAAPKTVSVASLKTAIPKLQKTLSALPKNVSGVTKLKKAEDSIKKSLDQSHSAGKDNNPDVIFDAKTVQSDSRQEVSNSDRISSSKCSNNSTSSSLQNLSENKSCDKDAGAPDPNTGDDAYLDANLISKSLKQSSEISDQTVLSGSQLACADKAKSKPDSISSPSLAMVSPDTQSPESKREQSSTSHKTGGDSDSDSDEDAMPSLDDVKVPETAPAKAQDQFRAMPSLNIARVNDACPVISASSLPHLNPPMLIKKEQTPPPTALTSAPMNMTSPPPMYCRAPGSNDGLPTDSRVVNDNTLLQQSDVQMDRRVPAQHLFPLPRDASRLALTPAQLLALNVPNKKVKAAKPKRERPPKKRKIKEALPVKKREKKRKIDKVQTLQQFEFSAVDKTIDKSVTMYHNSQSNTANHVFRRGMSDVHIPNATPQPFFRQTSEPILHGSIPYNNPNETAATAKRTDSDEMVYKPGEYFPNASNSQMGSPIKGGFISDSPYSNRSGILLSPPSDHNIFSPTSSDNNLSSETMMGDDSQLDNVDLGILNELDGCDLTDEQEKLRLAATKPKRGRKPKDPNKPRPPPRKRKPKLKAAHPPINGVYNNDAQANQYNASNSYQFPKQEGHFMGNPGGQDSPGKYYYYPGNETGYQQNNSPKVAVMPPSLQPQTVQQPSPLELPQCSNVVPQVSPPCQFSSENASYVQSAPAVAAPLSHFSPEQSTTSSTMSYPSQFSATQPFDTSYGNSNSTLGKQDPLEHSGMIKDNESDQTVRMNQNRGFGIQAQYPGPQSFNNEMFPSSMYPDHSFNTSTTSQLPPPSSGHPANNFSNQYQNFRNF